MSWQRSGELIIMIIFGGLGTLHGAIIGSLAYLLLGEWLSNLTEHWKMIFGPAARVRCPAGTWRLARTGGTSGGLLALQTSGAATVIEPVLRLEALHKSFGGLSVTRNLTFEIAAGELHAVIGPNGAGKTTLINQISGLIAPDSGRIVFAGRDVTALSVSGRAALGLARSFQITSILPGFFGHRECRIGCAGAYRYRASVFRPRQPPRRRSIHRR